ncbi:hypothetical protein JCM10212_006571 [Sporobolomyces blumeae]
MSAISSPDLAPPPPFLSSAVLAQETLYISGCCGQAKDGSFVGGTVADRTTQAMRNIESILRAAGMSLENVVSSTIYLSKYKEDFDVMNKAYVAAFPPGSRLPARTCIGVASLPKDTDVEITCTAVRGSSKL